MMLKNSIVDYNLNEADIKHWVELKGEFRYLVIIDVMKEKGIPTTWENVTNCVKYDKRLLINIFKYIVFLEEYYKSKLFEIKKIEKDKLILYEFSKTVREFLKIRNVNVFDNMDLNILSSEVDSIIDFRNSVVHNKILIGQTFKGKPLQEMLDIYSKILPESYREGYLNDVIKCDNNLNISSILNK